MKITRQEFSTVIQEYGIRVKTIESVQDNVLKVYADRDQCFCVKKVDYGVEKLQFIAAAMEHVSNKGFSQLSNVVKTNTGHSYLTIGNEAFLVTQWVPGVKADFGRETHLKLGTRTLAEFHNYSHGLQTPEGAKARVMWHSWPKTFFKRGEELLRFKEDAELKGHKTNFDRLFLENVDYYYEVAARALELLDKAHYHQIAQHSEAKRFFTHRDVAARNFVIDRNAKRGYLIDFDYCRYDIRATDLVRLVERTLKKHSWNIRKASDILNYYHKYNTILAGELPILLAFFVFPQKVWRVADRYYDKRKKVAENIACRRLIAERKDRAKKEKFLTMFERHFC